MIKSLYARLSLVLVVLLIVVGTAFFLIARFVSDMYYQEVTQRLNAPIAMYVADMSPLIQQGRVNEKQLKQLARQAMTINPSLEVYLLDKEGSVIAHAVDEKTIIRKKVSLDPINTFLSNPKKMPLQGDDPLSREKQKIFSAAPVYFNKGLEGYVYTIMGGKKHDELAMSLKNSYVLKLSLYIIVACLFFGLLCGCLTFFCLTRPLKILTKKVQAFRQGNFVDNDNVLIDNNDEIQQLSHAFNLMQARIQKQMESLQKNDQIRRELIANVSHDLRTPLASMQGYIETLLLKHDSLSSQQRAEYLAIARKNGVHLNRLIADLFQLAKLDANAIEPNLESFSLSELVYDIIHDYGLRTQEKSIQLQVDLQGSQHIIYADISLIQRVFQNLLDNALCYTPPGGSINIKLSRNNSGAVDIAVLDSGTGIAKDEVPYIFDRFYTVSNRPKKLTESTGLGLAIVKRILELHDSNITVESQINSGTCFSFTMSSEKREKVAA